MLTLILPIAGKGSRFSVEGYVEPKPFIDVVGESMIERSVSNLPVADKIVVVYRDEHEEWVQNWFKTSRFLPDNVVGVPLPHMTSGAACTVLAARDDIGEHDEVVIADPDQLLDWVPDHFLDFARRNDASGSMTVFRGRQSNWSYAYFDTDMRVESVIEKVPITSDAIAGVRYFRSGKRLMCDLEELVSEPVVGEYHLGSVYNVMIQRGDLVLAYPVPRVFSMGTPVELENTITSCSLIGSNYK
jgi:dTDP-glucose pyrophosphorylase